MNIVMNLKYFGRRFQHVIIGAEIIVNRLRGREFIKDDLGVMAIEISSICNLKCKFCAYEKKVTPKVIMSNEMFFDCVNQAVDLGYDRFELTPCTGDVFMDKHLFEKLDFLDNHPKVKEYSFFSNLTVPSHDQLTKLATLKKMVGLTISIYGHDEKSFVDITKSTPKVYDRLVSNLQVIFTQKNRSFPINFGWRSTGDVPNRDSSELMELLGKFKKAGIHVNTPHGVFNNWGGLVTQEDVAGLSMKIIPGNKKYKSGACAKLFDSIQVTASGIVNACSCRDVNSTLRIGDIRVTPLKNIISPENKTYMRLIAEQQTNKFSPICNGCDFYRSVYHKPTNYRRGKIPTQTIHKFLNNLTSKRKSNP
jgi:sulfatase maturation enzyme AslB (radical SAM superfamily)